MSTRAAVLGTGSWRGLRLERDLGAAEYRRLAYGERAADMRGYEFYRIACAHIADRPR